MFLIVKAPNAETATQYALHRGLSTYKCQPYPTVQANQPIDRFFVYTVDNADSERIISHWFSQCATKDALDKGFPHGTLLWYRAE